MLKGVRPTVAVGGIPRCCGKYYNEAIVTASQFTFEFVEGQMQNKSSETKIARVVNKYKLSDQPKDREFWLTRPPMERLAALELIRSERHKDDDESQRRLQRVYRIAQRT